MLFVPMEWGFFLGWLCDLSKEGAEANRVIGYACLSIF
jgi:hypothetical protein